MKRLLASLSVALCSLGACQTPPPKPVVPHAAKALRLGWPAWIGIVCDELPAQRRFYRDVLGLAERGVFEGSVGFDLDGNLLELFARSNLPQYAQRGVAFGFLVEDVRAARRVLLERGVTPVSDVDGASGDYWAYFRDAEGNLFEIVQHARPRKDF
jgi:catechol 2,3-dioxygenase-like lactoylglutathione lyase family enzyme